MGAEGTRGKDCSRVGGSKANRTTFGKAEFSEILTNFSPRSKQRSKNQVDAARRRNRHSDRRQTASPRVKNLQDCDYLVNYDIHWNPFASSSASVASTCIGSLNHEIQLVNFWPTPDLNKYINLKNRVEARMALVDIAATNEDNILNAKDLEELVQNDLRFVTSNVTVEG